MKLFDEPCLPGAGLAQLVKFWLIAIRQSLFYNIL